MTRYTTDEALAFIESLRLTIGDRVGFRWIAAKLDRLAEHIARMAEENTRLRERLEQAGVGSDGGRPHMLLELRVLPDRLAVCRLPAGAEPPEWSRSGGLTSVTLTAEETSVVCAESVVPDGVVAERGWRALQVAGPLDFGLTGVLAAIAAPLAEAGVSIFALSTYDTDYVLVRDEALKDALGGLLAAGHRVEPDDRLAGGGHRAGLEGAAGAMLAAEGDRS